MLNISDRRGLWLGALCLFVVTAVNHAKPTGSLEVNTNADNPDSDTTDNYCGVVIPVPTPTNVPNTCSLRAAIQGANADPVADTITFAASVNNQTLTLTDNLPAVSQLLDINASGLAGTFTVNGNDQFQALRYTGAAGAYSVNKLTITNSLNPAATGGGGIYFAPTHSATTKLTLTNVTISSSAASMGPGGGIAVADGRVLEVTGGAITGNTTTTRGGGIHITTDAFGPTGISDAGLTQTADDVLTLTNVSLASNSSSGMAAARGGGIYADLANGGDIKITASTLNANTATGGDGGNLWVRRLFTTSDLLVLQSTVSGGGAANGAGVAVKRGRLMIERSTLSGNSATGSGGGIYLDLDGAGGGSVLLENVTISGNSAAAGGGIGTQASNPAASHVVYTTITNNTGGGIQAQSTPNTTFPGNLLNPFTSNIIANNGGGNCAAAFSHADPNNSGFNLTDSTACGFNQATDRVVANAAALRLAALASNPVAPQTHALLSTSPAIDAGNPEWVPVFGMDERGANTQDGGADGIPGNGNLRRDIGAYEFGGFGLIEFRFPPMALASNYDVFEDAGPVMVTVARYGEGTAASSTPAVMFETQQQTPVSATAGTACGGATDYVTPASNPQTISFTAMGPMQFEQTRDVAICNDSVAEMDELFNILLTKPAADPVGYDLGTRTSGTVTIKDSENGTFQFNPTTASSQESLNGANMANGSVMLTITRTNGSKGRARVTYSTQDLAGCTPATTCATASPGAGADYTSIAMNTVIFEAGEMSKTVTVDLINDTLAEQGERFQARLDSVACIGAAPGNAVITGQACDAQLGAVPAQTSTVTIIDDDGASSLSIDDVNMAEGNGGTTAFVFKVTLAPPNSQTVTVHYATANGSATAPSDYTAQVAVAPAQVLSFAPGETEKTITVLVNGDTTFEADETFFVNLDTPTGGGAVIGDGQGLGTIQNDEATPTQGSIGFVNTAETANETGAPIRSFSVRRSGNNPTSTTVAVNFAITHPGYSTFVAGADPVACTHPSAPDYRITGAGGGMAPNATAITVNGDGTGTITFNGNSSTDALINVQVCDDARHESIHLLDLTLSNATNGAALGAAAARLTTTSNKQPRYQLTQTEASVREGNDAFVNLVVESLDPVDGERVCIPYQTVEGMGPGFARDNDPIMGADYEKKDFTANACDGALVWNNGQTGNRSVSIMLFDDGASDEPDETFDLALALAIQPMGFPAAGADVLNGADRARITITNLPRIFFSASSFSSLNEANTSSVMLTLTRFPRTSETSTVQFNVAPGTATNGSDYSFGGMPGVVTFGPGMSTADIQVPILGDAVYEGNENFTVTLSNPNNATLASPSSATGVIKDDEYRFVIVQASPVTVSEGAGSVTLTLRREGSNIGPASVSFATENGTATNPADYGAISSSSPGCTASSCSFGGESAGFDANLNESHASDKTITIAIENDTIDEADLEDFRLRLSMPSNNANGDAQAVGSPARPNPTTIQIMDDNDAVTVAFSADRQMVGENVGSVTVTATRTGATTFDITVPYTVTGSAGNPDDHNAASGSIMIPANASSGSVTFMVANDSLVEGNETVIFTMGTPTGGRVTATAPTTHTVTITDDDTSVRVEVSSPSPPSVMEDGMDVLVYTFTRSGVTTGALTVSFDVTGSAGFSSDYTQMGAATFNATAGTVTIPDNMASATVTLDPNADTTDEPDETASLTVTAGSGYTAGTPNAATGTITNDDTAPTLSISDAAAVTEGDMGSVNAVFTVSLSAPSGRTVTVTAATSNGSATAGANPGDPDYDANTQMLTFAPGDMAKTFTVFVNADRVDEPNEMFNATLTLPSNATLLDDRGVGTINDDDPTPVVRISSPTVAEGTGAGTTNAVFTVSLSNPSSSAVTMSFATANGTAVAPDDYTAQTGTGTVTCAANGTTCTPITVVVARDAINETTESFTVTLSALSSNATFTGGNSVATGTITDDDDASYTIDDVTVTEGNSGTTTATFTVTRTAGASPSTVDYTTASGTATEGTDFADATGTLSFPISATNSTQTISVTVNGDTVDETDETYNVNLSNPTGGAVIADDTGLGTISDDDAAPTVRLSLDPITLAENGGVATVTATLSNASTQTVTVTLAYSGTAGSGDFAASGASYDAGTRVLTIAAGSLSGSVTLTGVQDTIFEGNETIVTDIASVTNGTEATPAQQVTATISDDDAAPSVTLSLTGSPLAENGGVATVTATLSNASTQTVTVTLAYSGTAGSGDFSASGANYDAATRVLTIPAGNLTGSVSLTGVQDTIFEGNETIVTDIASVTNGTEATPAQQVTATISDDDNPPAVRIGNVTVIEGTGAGTTNAVFTVSLSHPSSSAVTMNFATANGSAVAPGDYTAQTGSVTCAANGTSCTPITVAVARDTVDEADENFTVQLSGLSANATFTGGNNAATGTISDDDGPSVTLSLTGSPLAENGGVATVTATLSATSAQTVTVNLAYSGTAANPADYTRSGTQIVIAAGSPSGSVTLTGVQDTVFEGNETIVTDIASVTNGTENGTQTVTATISDDDPAPSVTLSLSGSPLAENGGVATVTATLSNASSQTVTVSLAYAGTAANPADYTRSDTQIVIAAGSLSGSVTLTGVQDTLFEGDETIVTDISSVTNGTESGTQTVSATISDDDAAPSVSLAVSPATFNEESPGNTSTLTATLNGATTTFDVTVNLSYTGAAANGSDYTGAASITIPAGQTSASITLTALTDTIDESTGESLTATIASVSSNATIGSPNSASATITDNDTAGVTVAQSGGTTAVAEGGATDTYTLVLNSQPTANVTITLNPGSQLSVSPATVTFTPANFATPQTVTVAAVNDAVAEGDHSGAISHSVASADAIYQGIATAAVTAAISDNDAAGVTVVQSGGSTAVTEGGVTDSYSVALSSQPLANVIITINAGAQLSASPSMLTFTPANFATPQTVTFTAVNDDQIEGTHTATVSGTSSSSDPSYNGSLGSVTVTITDNDSVAPGENAPAVVVTQTGGSVNVSSSQDSGGAFSLGSLLGLLGLLVLRRAKRKPVPSRADQARIEGCGRQQFFFNDARHRRQLRAAVLGLLALAPASVMAQELSYRYGDLRYVRASVDQPSVDASGYSLAGSWKVAEQIYLTGSYGQSATDDFQFMGVTGSSESESFSLGAGFRREMRPALDFNLAGAVVSSKATGEGGFTGEASDTGFAVETGLRGQLPHSIEWGAGLSYLAIFEDGVTTVSVQGLYHISPELSLAAGGGLSDDSTQFNAGLRLRF